MEKLQMDISLNGAEAVFRTTFSPEYDLLLSLIHIFFQSGGPFELPVSYSMPPYIYKNTSSRMKSGKRKVPMGLIQH